MIEERFPNSCGDQVSKTITFADPFVCNDTITKGRRGNVKWKIFLHFHSSIFKHLTFLVKRNESGDWQTLLTICLTRKKHFNRLYERICQRDRLAASESTSDLIPSPVFKEPIDTSPAVARCRAYRDFSKSNLRISRSA